jgi:hypothetical protein
MTRFFRFLRYKAILTSRILDNNYATLTVSARAELDAILNKKSGQSLRNRSRSGSNFH